MFNKLTEVRFEKVQGNKYVILILKLQCRIPVPGGSSCNEKWDYAEI